MDAQTQADDKTVWRSLVVAAAAAAYFPLFLHYGLEFEDEGLILAQAEELLSISGASSSCTSDHVLSPPPDAITAKDDPP